MSKSGKSDLLQNFVYGQPSEVLKFFATHYNAQDKVFRAIYYFGMYLKWQAKKSGFTPDTLDTISRVASSAGRWRKMQRMLKSPNLWRGVIQTAMESDPSKPLINICKFLSKLFGTLYITFDHLKYLYRIGLWHPKSKEQRLWAFWLGSLWWLLDITFDSIWRILHMYRTPDMKRTDLNKNYRRLVKNLIDLPCVLHPLKWLGMENCPTPVIGICGTIVSLMPLYEIWPKSNYKPQRRW